MSENRTYTVVLLYPDYLTDDHGADIYVQAFGAPSPEAAVCMAQLQCREDNGGDIDPDDLRMILVMEGDVKVVGDANGIYDEQEAAP